MIASICERWGMTVDDSARDPQAFHHWVLKYPNQVSGHLTRSWHAYQSVLSLYGPGVIKSAVEYFGGIGAHALMIQELFEPEKHVVYDYSQDAVEHLRRAVPLDVQVEWGDAYHPANHVAADLVAFDCGDMTAWRTRDGENVRMALDRIFEAEPKAVLITDIACPYLHLHRSRYESLLGPGTCETYESYMYALAGRLEALYGYTMLTGFFNRWSSPFVMVPAGAAKNGVFQPTPWSPVGLELL